VQFWSAGVSAQQFLLRGFSHNIRFFSLAIPIFALLPKMWQITDKLLLYFPVVLYE
jgi:hypothetical protein